MEEQTVLALSPNHRSSERKVNRSVSTMVRSGIHCEGPSYLSLDLFVS